MEKAPEAFRTISEVAEALQTPAHVLRFWESKFTQVRPVKRAGGRRYYRPADMDLLFGIRSLLHDQGMTIRGVQKMLQEHGAAHVAFIGRDAQQGAAIDGDATDVTATVAGHSDQMGHDSPASAESSWVEEDPESAGIGGPDNIIDMRPSSVGGRNSARAAAAHADADDLDQTAPAGPVNSTAKGETTPDDANEPVGQSAAAAPARCAAKPAAPNGHDSVDDTTDDASLLRDSAHALAIRLRQMKREDLAPKRTDLSHVAERLDRHLNLLARRSGAGRS